MQVIVCVKQIPDPASPYQLDPDNHLLVRPDDQILDETDRYGVEMGLQIAQEHEGTVSLVSMGPTGSMQGIRQALAMGAEDATLIDDQDLKGSDALATAWVLAKAISQRDGYDLVIAGTESTDGYAGVAPQMLAEVLGVPCLTYVTEVTVEQDTVTVHRQTDAGYDVVTAQLPAVIAVTAGVVEPRYPTFKGIMQAKKKPVEVKTSSDLDVETNVGQKVTSITEAPERSAGEKIEDDGEAHLRIVELLEQKKVI